ncbi:MAG: hypothetical protein PHN84_00445 [Desulfuromonadaceae bacterium]|nr:hypothetical protein [Desulfuromonadaceae bacterium]MDD2854270.1 hypothetical protein [Desulfuromonadaceae bacterium]
MAIKLGEMLLKEKLISPEQLDEALKCLSIFGIKLGSSLIELGYITDEQLCKFLSHKLGVPNVSHKILTTIPPEVLALVPAELAGRYRVIPIRTEGKKLALAMADPTDFKAIEEVAFVTGCVILPHIVPDVRITSALSKYYQIRGDIRYLRIEGEIANKRKSAPVQNAVKKAEKIAIPMVAENGDLLNIEIPLEFEGFASIPGHEEDFDQVVDGVERYTVDRLSIEFASAKNRDQIATVFIKYLGQEFRMGALFIIRNNMAVGWRGVASEKRIEDLENLTILLSKPSVMRDILETRHFSMGTLIQTPENVQLLKILGVTTITPLLVLPIIMLNKVVAAVVVSADMDALGKRLQELQRLVYKASLAFEMLIIKNKILMT